MSDTSDPGGTWGQRPGRGESPNLNRDELGHFNTFLFGASRQFQLATDATPEELASARGLVAQANAEHVYGFVQLYQRFPDLFQGFFMTKEGVELKWGICFDISTIRGTLATTDQRLGWTFTLRMEELADIIQRGRTFIQVKADAGDPRAAELLAALDAILAKLQARKDETQKGRDQAFAQGNQNAQAKDAQIEQLTRQVANLQQALASALQQQDTGTLPSPAATGTKAKTSPTPNSRKSRRGK